MENTTKTYKRIGTFTFGLTLIILGIVVIIQTFLPFDLLRYTLMLWPIVFISIGAETLYYLFKKDIQIKYDFLGIILSIFLVFLSSIFSIVNYGVNKILFEPSIQEDILSIVNNNPYRFYYDSKASIVNLTSDNIYVKIVENENISNSIHFYVSSNLENKLLETIISDELHNFVNIHYDNENNIKVLLTQLPDYIDTVEIIVYTNNTNSITLDNCNVAE